jgi:predicted acylesterase/phospholipase RssA
LIILIVAISGCGVPIAVNSVPGGADVYLDGEFVGNTPVIVRVSDFAEDAVIKCELDGYEPQERIITKQYSTEHTISGTNAYAYSPRNNTSVYGTGMTTQTTLKGHWPAEIFFRLHD